MRMRKWVSAHLYGPLPWEICDSVTPISAYHHLSLPNIEKMVLPLLPSGEKTSIVFRRKAPIPQKGLGSARFLNFEGRRRWRYRKRSWSQFCNTMAVRRADSRARRLIGNTEREGECNNERRETTERHCKEEDIDVLPWCNFVMNICCSFSAMFGRYKQEESMIGDLDGMTQNGGGH